jgi:hypothetical protein
MPARSMRRGGVTESSIRFCPFCREPFEDIARCPTHDIELVTLRALGAITAASVPDDAPLPLWSPRRGRGLLFSGALITLLAFFCPLATLSGELHASNTLLALARARAPRLWLVPLAAFALFSLLYRRRTANELRAARVGSVFLALIPSAVVIFTLIGVHDAVRQLAAQRDALVQLQIGWGAWLVFLAGVLLVWGSAVLGVRRAQRVR